jgi:hypothetical protein
LAAFAKPTKNSVVYYIKKVLALLSCFGTICTVNKNLDEYYIFGGFGTFVLFWHHFSFGSFCEINKNSVVYYTNLVLALLAPNF